MMVCNKVYIEVHDVDFSQKLAWKNVLNRISTAVIRTVSLVLALFARRTLVDMQESGQMDIGRAPSMEIG